METIYTLLFNLAIFSALVVTVAICATPFFNKKDK